MTHMGTDVNELDPAEQELVDFLVPPPRPRRGAVIRSLVVLGVVAVVVVLRFTNLALPGLHSTTTTLWSDTEGRTVVIEFEVRNERIFPVDIERFELRGAAGQVVDPQSIHLSGGATTTITLTIDGVPCGAWQSAWLDVYATPVLPITQRADRMSLGGWGIVCNL